MKIQTEKEKFSQRLKLAISSAYPQQMKTSEIATKFNLQYENEAVTPQAVHKWLNSLAIPANDKIQTLSKWLNVKPEWLRYGTTEEKSYSAVDDVLIEMISKLSEEQKVSLVQFISGFYKS
ncbi:transcriptional regulator [Vespertiliibacter pulmonis]|uniref:HTH cro/C1-type domain-containing protein n=1 Tax=Vespertiliibacter pulmonis TaxID=1443036 RepID=A0A3N4VCR8_9PAST|nr:transcriptional regulator [Vespertiliibacter pulmonis]QLB20505.1 transcriptional regulator [Vespertiliibacter pulmonis]RPE80812.1 hypothetical protein EDC46_1632 [Vespertiliibacter pulmonis]